MFRKLALLAALALAFYTQLYKLAAVPGLHFDEAWQGLFAHRIATEAGFYPTIAMNSYTTPVVHYLLAGAFKIFGPTLSAMRGTFAVMNLISLILVVALLWRARERNAAIWFTLLWALLPLSVHNHRFYVEMTGFFGLCLAIVLWGFALWEERPALSSALLIGGVLAGAYSHILFVAVFAAGVFVGAQSFPRQFRSPRTRVVVGLTAALLVPLALRMGAGLDKKLPYLLAAGLAAIGAWAVIVGRFPRMRRLYRWTTIVSVPFLIGFIGLMWNGIWPYAQATGHLDWWTWLPVNVAIFVGLLLIQFKTLKLAPLDAPGTARAPRERYLFSPTLAWNAFVVTFLFSSVMIFKQSPRYYMATTILAMLWCALRLARLRKRSTQIALAVVFIGWNLWAFQSRYIARFEREGSTTKEFRVGIYHDNGRDFRPFQKAFEWAVSQNCQKVLRWVEDDRFLLPVDFLRLAAPQPKGDCPWSRDDLFFSHIENYNHDFKEPRTEHNTPPPSNAPHVKLLAHFREWGDLAFWIRK